MRAISHGIPGLLALAAIAGCQPPGDVGNAADDARVAPDLPAPTAAVARADVVRAAPAAGSSERALARIVPVAGQRAIGTAEFALEGDGQLAIHVELEGLEPGGHGFHIHENGDCSAPGESSMGEHFAPDGDPHGPPEAAKDAHHAGDLGNIVADSSGSAVHDWVDDELTLEGTYGVVGRAIIVHAGPDDLMTQPSGDSGDPVACGVVMSAPLDATSAR